MSDPGPARAGESRLRLGSFEVGLLVTLSLLWGSAYLFIRAGIVQGASPLAFAATRYALSAAAFVLLGAIRREAWPQKGALAVSAGVGGVLLIGLYGGFLYWGEQSTTGGYAAALSASVPILTVAASYSLLPQERLGPLALGGIALGSVGVVVLVLPDLAAPVAGNWSGAVFVVAAFVSTSVGSVLLRRFGGGRQGLYQIGTQFAVGTVVLGVGMLFAPGPEVVPWTAPVLGSLVALVVLASLAGYFVYFLLHHRIGPGRANVVAYLLPLVGIGLGSGLFGEPVTIWEVVGFVTVLGGVTLVTRGSRPAP